MITMKHSGSIAQSLRRVSLARYFLRAMKTKASEARQLQEAAVVVSAVVAAVLRQLRGTHRQPMQIRPHNRHEHPEHRLRCRLISRACSNALFRFREFQNANTLSSIQALQ